MRARLILQTFFLAAALLAGAGTAAAQGLATEKTVAGGVTVTAKPRELPGGAWQFEIVFDTHTQELKDEPAKSASLLADGKSYAATGWRSDPPGGHHRKGVLEFGPVTPRPQGLELHLSRPGEAKARVFRWQLK
jgi:hypothetical protein